ncbi:MAG: uroporphyrinogen decarboxylase family protein [Thermoleophilia bacterium]
MDSRERVRAALSGDRPDRLPCALGFFPQSLYGAPDADELFGTDVRFVEFDPPPGQEDFTAYLEGLLPDVHVGTPGQLRTYWEWGYHPESGAEHPLASARSAADVVEGLLPDLTHPARYGSVAARVRRFHDRGLAVAAPPPHLGGELFESAYRLRGFERFMRDLLEDPPLVEYLLDQLAGMLVHNTLVLAEAGVDVLLLDDDVASSAGLLMSPATWRAYFKPRLVRVIGAAREVAPELLVFYHSDGDFSRLVPDLVEVGVDVINPLQPDCMDARALRAALGPRPAFWGTVGTARLWGEGSPEEVWAEVRQRAATLGPAGLLLAPAYDIDFAPRENVVAFVEAVRALA